MTIALTGYGRPEDEKKVKEAGFDHHLVKPADVQVLKDIIIRASKTTNSTGYKARASNYHRKSGATDSIARLVTYSPWLLPYNRARLRWARRLRH